MTVLITDYCIIEKLIELEGEQFRRFLTKEEFGDQSFEVFFDCFQKCKKDGFPEKERFLIVNGSRAIYGLDGWHRYFVQVSDGAVFFSSAHSSPGIEKKALDLGFGIF